ncbi:hypothetical protein pdam_00022594 [Pocillopora damicornis]|uniref:Uncharacterized protein n=1 Tax=Pocillopora damicornis TaxID=46731 RepID=A0A3M6UU14_POCDA|nr:hypothetical protein pdam_00022594 [Pocillopora damicornis]
MKVLIKWPSNFYSVFKVYRELLTRSNIIECFANEAILRFSALPTEFTSQLKAGHCVDSRLCHPHIVTFYSAVFRKVPRGLKAAFVTECPGVDLKKYLIDQPGNCPAKNSAFSENAIRWADQNSF